MITGANTNVRYRGVVFHVQTEDSGPANPRIISHLYHGGTILASEKTDYSDRMGEEDLEVVVRALIEKQHQEMLKRLKKGGFDAVIAERLGDTADERGAADTPPPAPARKAAVAAEPPRPPAGAAPRSERTFGAGIVSQKPLDEVILEYLAEKARGRNTGRAAKPARKNPPGR